MNDPKLTTLFGGRLLTVNFEPVADPAAEGGWRLPPAEEVRVRQVPVRDYETGVAMIQDEPALCAFLVAKPKAWALNLAPDSYEALLATGREVNARGFFSFCRRRTEQIEKENAAMIGAMSMMPPEMVKLAMEKGLEMRTRSHSPTSSPGFVPPPVR